MLLFSADSGRPDACARVQLRSYVVAIRARSRFETLLPSLCRSIGVCATAASAPRLCRGTNAKNERSGEQGKGVDTGLDQIQAAAGSKEAMSLLKLVGIRRIAKRIKKEKAEASAAKDDEDSKEKTEKAEASAAKGDEDAAEKTEKADEAEAEFKYMLLNNPANVIAWDKLRRYLRW